MSTVRKPYSVQHFAPGSYDVLIGDRILAALARNEARVEKSDAWQLELLIDMPAVDRPSPFTEQCHPFPSFGAALEWVGICTDADAPSSNLHEQLAS